MPKKIDPNTIFLSTFLFSGKHSCSPINDSLFKINLNVIKFRPTAPPKTKIQRWIPLAREYLESQLIFEDQSFEK